MTTEIILYKQQLADNPKFSLLPNYGWGFTGSAGVDWEFTSNLVKKLPGTAQVIYQEDKLIIGVEYYASFVVSARTQGTLVFKTLNGGTAHISASSNNVHQVAFVSDGTDLRLEASNTFNGSISNFSITEYPVTSNLDLFEEAPIPLNFIFDDIRQPENRKTSYSKTVVLPASHKNNIALKHIYEINSEGSFNPNRQSRAIIKNEGLTMFDGVLCLDDIIMKNGAPYAYNVSFIGLLKDVFSLWGNKKVNELDFSEYKHVYQFYNIINSWYGNVFVNGNFTSNTQQTYTSPAIISMSKVSFNGVDRVKVEFASPHSFAIGDDVFGETSNNLLSGNQSVVDANVTSITLNLLWAALKDLTTPTGVFTDFHFQGFGYVYPMIDMGTINQTDHNDQVIISEDQLQFGVSYIIKSYKPGDNFIPYGAASNFEGIEFVCTSVTGGTWSNGSQLSTTDVSNWRVRDFYPGFFLREILEKSFKMIGYTFDFPFADTQMFKRIVIPWPNGETFALTPEQRAVLEFRASMQDTITEPNGHEFETAYNLYPFPANHGDYPDDNVNIPPGTDPPQPFFWSPFYQNLDHLTVDFNYDGFKPIGYPSSGLYFDGQGFVERNFFVEGCTYDLVDFKTGDDFTPVGGANADNTTFVATLSGGNPGAWTQSSTIQPKSPFASHHCIQQSGGAITTKVTTPIPLNHNQPPTDFDEGNNWSIVLYQYEMPPGYSSLGVDFRFTFSATVSNYVKDNFAFNGTSGDLPSDYAGTSAPGIYTTHNGTYVGGLNALPASNDRTDVNTDFYNGIIIQKSVDGGTTWTNIKYLGTNGDNDPYSATRFDKTFVSGYVDVNLLTSDLIRVIGYSNIHFIALRSDGLPCRGASAGGSAGSGFTTAGGNGATGGPVKMTFRVENALFTAFMTARQIPEDFEYDPTIALPNVKISDLFISVLRAFNLLVEPKDDNVLLIDPRDSYYDFNGSKIDWTEKLNIGADISQKPMARFNARDYIFTYKEGQDYYNQNYKKNWAGVEDRIYGDAIINTDNDFVTNTNKTEIIFNPSPMVGSPAAYINSDRVISAIFSKDNEDGPVKKIQSLNLLFYNIRGTDNKWRFLAQNGNQIDDVKWPSGDFRFYPQATHMDNHLSPKYDLNFRNPLAFYFGLSAATVNTLYDLYHKRFIEAITNKYSKLVTIQAKLSVVDIASLNFRKLIIIDNKVFLLSKITDWNINSDGLCAVELLKL